jgi:hypothetical protein
VASDAITFSRLIFSGRAFGNDPRTGLRFANPGTAILAGLFELSQFEFLSLYIILATLPETTRREITMTPLARNSLAFSMTLGVIEIGPDEKVEPNEPFPDKPSKEIRTLGFFFPAIAKTNSTVLCGTGRLTANVEAQVCTQAHSAPPHTAPSPVPPATQKPVSAVSSVEPLNLYESTNVAAKQKAPEPFATPSSLPTSTPEVPMADEADTRQKLINGKGAPATPEASMASRYWGIPEKPLTTAPWPESEKPFTPVEAIKQYWGGKRFSPEFFSGTYGKNTHLRSTVRRWCGEEHLSKCTPHSAKVGSALRFSIPSLAIGFTTN